MHWIFLSAVVLVLLPATFSRLAALAKNPGMTGFRVKYMPKALAFSKASAHRPKSSALSK
jgi:hypothetical protein